MLVFVLLLVTVAITTGDPSTINFGMRKLAFSTNQFGIDLFRAMDSTSGDIAFCPFCISSSLAMLLLGAREETATSLRQALYLWGMRPAEIHRAFRDLLDHVNSNLRPALQQRSFRDHSNDLVYYSTMYMQRDFGAKYPYQLYLERFYNTTAHPLDFVLNGEETRQHINAIIERNTGGKLKEMLPETPPRNTNILMMSGVFFQGSVGVNMTLVEGSGKVRMESRKARVRYGRHPYLNCTAIEIPFQNGLVSLVLLVPNEPEGIGLLENRLSAQRLSDMMDNLEVKKGSLLMPRIKVEQRYTNLTNALRNLGLFSLFEPGFANLLDISDYGWLHVSNIIHKAVVDIREGHAASDAAGIDTTDQDFRLSIDRPFLFFIVDSLSSLSLVMGKLNRL